MRCFPSALKIIAACVMVAGLGGGCAAAATGRVPPALVGTFTADVPISLGQRCPNGELIGVRYIRTLTMRADGTADLNAVNIDAGQTDGCSRTGGTCNITDTIEDGKATAEIQGSRLIIETGTGRETLKSVCNPAINTARNIRTRTVTAQWALVTSPKTGRQALRLAGAPFGITCPNSFNKTGNDCPTVLFERVH
jgi:hypothetical protein